MSKDKISFIAALNSATAIKIDGDGEVKVTLQVPSSEIAEVTKLLLYIKKTFIVSITEDSAEEREDVFKDVVSADALEAEEALSLS